MLYLAIKAARALARATGYRRGVHLEIEKNVPIAGGMGGGSADAAATLLACDALWGTACTREQLLGAVWGYSAAAGTRTVDVHVAQLRAKLGSASPIRTVRGTGYAAERR